MGNDEKQELSGIKLKNGILIGKKANKTTPSKLGFHNSSSLLRNFPMNNSVSARKIGANLWEVQPQFNFSKDHADHGGAAANLSHHRRRRHRSHDIERFEDSDRLDEKQPPDSDPQPPEIETISRSNIRELPSLRHLSVGKNGNDLQHVSSASCCSSMQVTPFIKAATPIGYTVKTSTHLLKILNRIWNLEEQHSLNVALIKTLKRELGISRAQITTLIEERKRDRQEMDEWKKSINDRKKKAIESTRDELLDIKSSLMRERKARILLESLCDEFANGIRDYEQKVRFLQQNRGKKDQLVSENEPDRLILHVSEAWLDERVQMKCDFSEKTSISDNLCCEIETFLEAKKKQSRGSGVEPDELLENTEPSLQLVPRMTDRSLGVAEPSSQLMSRMERLQDHGGAEPSMPRRAGRGSDATEPSSKSITRGRDRGSGVAEPRAREGAKSNTLMAKLLEARLESQFSKPRTLRR
ncbi:uncharacterized protein At5g41620 [Cynara cardunculus var. scolymus]|uniref:uncharacterized protein At5g41620 n=1 Tax=Cynara cardunculus var. scolymus TaxID=59895 RepID=UPI000D6238FC|nr:uncharacterized protein At5g41620 [Cynara cardunculus var. scolymus]